MRRTPRRIAWSRAACLAVALLAAGRAFADAPAPAAAGGAQAAPAARAARVEAGQGVAVVGSPAVRDEAFSLARAVYATRLRPASLDEAHARVLAGGEPGPGASRDLRELAELRAGVVGNDAASRRVLEGIAEQLGVKGLLVVRAVGAGAGAGAGVSAGGDAGADADASANEGASAEAGANGSAEAGAGGMRGVEARLFVAETGELDAARYVPEEGMTGAAAWAGAVASVERRFPAPAAPVAATHPMPPAKHAPPKEGESKPFYASPWFWGSLGAAVLVGGAFFFASRDTSSQPIHLDLRLPK